MRIIGLALLIATAMGMPAMALPVAITGATLIDVSDFGRSERDIPDAVVVIDGEKIVAAGPASEVVIPRGARRITAKGGFLVPGLIDGFAALRDQGFANAFLYEGVTSVYLVAPDGSDERRGRALLSAIPSPHLLLGGAVTGYSAEGDGINSNAPDKTAGPDAGSLTAERLTGEPLSRAAISARVRALGVSGARGVWMDYDVWPVQVDAVVQAAAPLHLGVIGELGFTSYPYAIRAGVGAFVHNQRYQSAFAKPVDQLRYADDPFGPGGDAVENMECTLAPDSPAVVDLGRQLAKSKSVLMPTAAMDATLDGMFGLPNPWLRPAAAQISPDLLFLPVDRDTGEIGYMKNAKPERRKKSDACARNMLAVDRALHMAGARFLAASGTSAFGIMPGGGMHEETALLQQYVGLTPREALAAATSNYADAFGWSDVGRIEPGRYADILILDKDPRADIAALESIRTVILAGQPLNRAALLTFRKPGA